MRVEILVERGGALKPDSCNRFRCRRTGREEVEQLGTGGTHREPAGERRRELVHAEKCDVAAHRRAREVDAARGCASIELREQVRQRHRVLEADARDVAVAPVARCRPGKPAIDQALADGRRLNLQARSVRAAVRHEAVGAEHQLAIPLVGDLDLIHAAGIVPGERFGSGERFNRRVDRRPLLASDTGRASVRDVQVPAPARTTQRRRWRRRRRQERGA